MAAPNKTGSKYRHTEQEVLVESRDDKYDVIAVEVVAENGDGTALVRIPAGAITPKTGTVTASGDTVILSVSAGQYVKLYHISFVPTTGSGVDRDVVLKIGTTSIMGWRTNTSGGGFAHSPKNGQAWFEGADGEDVILNLSGADSIRYNITYDLVTV